MNKLPNKKLTTKEEDFCNQYIIDFNGAQAALRAKYSEKTARQIAANLLSKVYILGRINELLEERRQRIIVKQDRVVYELAKLAFSDIRNYTDEDGSIDLSKIDDFNSQCIQEITEDITTGGSEDRPWEKVKRKIKLYDKQKAIEMLGKHLVMFTDKTELSGPDGQPIDTNLTIEFVKSDK
jgi:phage terminase small subunit